MLGLRVQTPRWTYTQNNTNTDIHALSGIRTHDPRVQASEDTSCLRPRDHYDRLDIAYTANKNLTKAIIYHYCIISLSRTVFIYLSYPSMETKYKKKIFAANSSKKFQQYTARECRLQSVLQCRPLPKEKRPIFYITVVPAKHFQRSEDRCFYYLLSKSPSCRRHEG
jgi:hypothetical protein